MNHSARNSGFGLVEILVGLAIGILGMIVMVQMFSITDAGRRTASGNDDAQTTGAIAMYTLERDIRQSGYGLTSIRLIACNVLLPTGVTLNGFAPVTINHASVPAGDTNTDTLVVVTGSNHGAQEGDVIVTQPAASYPRTYTVQTISSHAPGDQIIAQVNTAGPATPCNLRMEPIAAIVPGTSNIDVATGLAAASNGYIFNMGAKPHIYAYAIRNSKLTQCDFMLSDCTSAAQVANPAVWQPIASNIVSLRAQYGRDDAPAQMDAIVDLFDQTTPDYNATTTACDFSRIFSVRMVLVARNQNPEKTEGGVTTVAPTWLGSDTTPISLEEADEWKQYRYKVFQTVIPIRNVIATGVVPPVNGAAPC
jgi:type IV pilus assembly protein PilW